MKTNKLLKTITVFFLLFFLIGSLLLATAYYFNSPPSHLEASTFEVFQGESLASIAERLEKASLIRSSVYLKIISRLLKADSDFKAGKYRIEPGSSTIDIFYLCIEGRHEQIKVTIPEGKTSKQLAQILEEAGVCPGKEFLLAAGSAELLAEYELPGTSFEGYLYPDTYYFDEGQQPVSVIKIMIDNFFAHLKSVYPDFRQLSPQALYAKIIVASIVEREYRIEEEAPMIASVFYNRLERHMGLESCATIEYIITVIQGKKHPGFITVEDTKSDSPYNTYKWAGLPPGPIANPGYVALHASFFPENSSYYYFVLKDPTTGVHSFSHTLEEHNQKKRYYLK